MQLNIFKNRILSEGKVYLLLSDCADILETTTENLEQICKDIKEIGNFGKCITENEFNFIFKEYFPEANTTEQMTTYQTLDARALDIFKLYPIKMIFSEEFMVKGAEYGLTAKEYIKQIDFPEEISKEKLKLNVKRDIEEEIKNYKIQVEEGIKDVNNIPFEKFGLELQHLTVIDNGHVSFRTFYVGDGIFYSIMPEYMMDDIWEEAEEKDGIIKVPSVDYTSGYIELSKEVNRDFRKYSVMENIIYCTQNITAIDEWQDYIEYRKGGVSMDVNKMFLAKLINPRSWGNTYFIEGIPHV